MINWKVRAKNLTFWISLIPAVALLVTTVCEVFGVPMDLSGISDKLINVVKAVFSVLAILGIVADPTTSGVGDSDRALMYDRPWKDVKEDEE